MATLKKAISILTPTERKQGLLVLMMVIGMALLEIGGIVSVMPFLAVLGNLEMIQTNSYLSILYTESQVFGINSPDEFLILLGVGSFILINFSAVYRTFTHYYINRFIEMRRHTISSRLLETYLRQPYAFFLGRHSGDMSKIILSEVDQLVGNFFRPIFNMIAYSFVLIAITILLVMVNPLVSLFAAGIMGVLYIFVFLSLKQRLTRLGLDRSRANKERFLAANEVFGGIKEIKLLGCEDSYLSRFQKPSKQFANSIATNVTLNQIPRFMIEAFAFGGIIFIVLFLIINSGGLSSDPLGQVLPIIGLYAFSAYRIQPALQNMFSGFSSLRFGKAAIESLYIDLHLNDAIKRLPQNKKDVIKAKKNIVLQNLTYTYPNTKKPALKDLNLEIPVGSALGLVGTTGSGKTTLVDVILGLLRPTNGSIVVDNSPISDNQLSSWQKFLGYVPQEIFLTDTSISENIALGVPKEKINQKQVENCARMAHLHHFIEKDLPAKYETLVGERGVRLSGGQRQRIGIARALYFNPGLLVFDEATSALDTLTEQAVMDAIDTLAHEKTIILIAHRLATVRKCDQIVLLDRGTINAKGSYKELLRSNEQFKSML